MQHRAPLVIFRLILMTAAFGIGRQGQAAAAQTWPFVPPKTFAPAKPLLDLRSLNEKVAGEHGFIKLSADGRGFVRGDGQPIRFWAVGSFAGNLKGFAATEQAARFLAHYGVNMARFHCTLAPTNPGSRITDVNVHALHALWKQVAAMKQQGIYTTISPYWAVAVHIQKSWHVPGNSASAASLLFWDPTMQRGYQAWLRALLTRPNPYTGIPLGKDPAVAIISLQNEDSLLFWNMQAIVNVHSGETAQRLEIARLYAHWLITKYGSLHNALLAWKGVHAPGDDFAHGVAGMFLNWFWTQPQTGGMAVRLADQLHFFARVMYHFNKKMVRYIHRNLGARQLINAGNWKTVDPLLLNDVERWTYTAGNVMAVNRYTTGIHIGRNSGWAIQPGDLYTNFSCLLHPQSIPVNLKQVIGFPMMVTEGQWVAPDRYQAEGPFLVAAYSSLTGVAGYYWFAINHQWQQPFKHLAHSVWQPPMAKWQIGTPQQLGQFPAAALLYRRGYIRPGKPTVIERRSLQGLWNRRPPIIAEGAGYDPNRDRGVTAMRLDAKTAVSPLAFLVGPVLVSYHHRSGHNFVRNLAAYIQPRRGIVSSDTRQISLNYHLGICTLNTARAKGVVGFLGRREAFNLPGLRITCRNAYASILLVSMDGLPLQISRQILVQVGTIARPTGWKSAPATLTLSGKRIPGYRVISTGQNPWQVRNIKASITLNNAVIHTATLLNPDGFAAAKVPLQRHGGQIQLQLPPDMLYLVLGTAQK
ncbi:MAG: hypothetical protein HKL95_02105 [Phycisphaerae bacterium]|nr:hypothetical protein [Phycisphaerae bacterium]